MLFYTYFYVSTPLNLYNELNNIYFICIRKMLVFWIIWDFYDFFIRKEVDVFSKPLQFIPIATYPIILTCDTH